MFELHGYFSVETPCRGYIAGRQGCFMTDNLCSTGICIRYRALDAGSGIPTQRAVRQHDLPHGGKRAHHPIQ